MSAGLLLADAWDGHRGDWGAGWWILMVAMMVAFWAVVIVLVVWLVRSLGFGRQPLPARSERDRAA